jgi:hypothetical protein
VKEEEKEEEI